MSSDSNASTAKVAKTGTQLLQEMSRNRYAHRMVPATSHHIARDMEVIKVVASTVVTPPKAQDGAKENAVQAEKSVGAVPPPGSHPHIKTDFPLRVPGDNLIAKDEAVLEMEERLPKEAPFETVLEVAAEAMKTKVERLLRRRRTHDISRPRQAVIYFLCERMGYKHDNAAAAFQMDRSTVIHAKAVITERLAFGPTTKVEMIALAGLKKLCEHFGKEVPASPYWETLLAELQNNPPIPAAD